jgi:hypothetical protein
MMFNKEAGKMRTQNEIKSSGPLLDANGVLTQRGYATKPLLTYKRNAIKAPPWRIKEWDFYQVSDGEQCVQFTIGHTSYAGALTVTFFRFADGLRYDKNTTRFSGGSAARRGLGTGCLK